MDECYCADFVSMSCVEATVKNIIMEFEEQQLVEMQKLINYFKYNKLMVLIKTQFGFSFFNVRICWYDANADVRDSDMY